MQKYDVTNFVLDQKQTHKFRSQTNLRHQDV